MCPTPREEAIERSEHAGELVERLKEANECIRGRQKELRQQDSEERLLFAPYKLMSLLESFHQSIGMVTSLCGFFTRSGAH